MLAISVATQPQRRLILSQRPEPADIPGFVRVRVGAISLNRGEVTEALNDNPEGDVPGHDFAGTVETAPEASGIRPGQRVVGLLPSGAWSECVAVPAFMLTPVPDGVSLEQAATLPVAGLSARLALDRGGDLAGRKVLVTGATGGVGALAVQLAALDGAEVTAFVRQAGHAGLVKQLGAKHIAATPQEAAALGRFDLIIDNVGGALLGKALLWLAPGGTCVLVGNAGGDDVTFDAFRFRNGEGAGFGGTSIYGFFLGYELQQKMPGPVLTRLLGLVAEGRLDPLIRVRGGWSQVDTIARQLLDRGFIGKAVLTPDGAG